MYKLHAPYTVLSPYDNEYILPIELNTLRVRGIQTHIVRHALRRIHIANECVNNAAMLLSFLHVIYPNAITHAYDLSSMCDDDTVACDTDDQMHTLNALVATRRITNTDGLV